MPLDYGRSNRMRDAITAMRAHAVNDKVGLVMRWNKRTDMIWTIYSEFLNQVDALNIPVDQRARFERWNGDAQEENEVFTPAVTVSQVGCHAEEIMIVNWSYFELEAAATILAQALGREEPAPWADVQLRTERFALTEVDLVLSKSPCTGPGGSQPLSVGVHTYGTGCSMKLWNFCAQPRFRNVQWRIFYCGLPPEKSDTRLAPRVMPPTLTTPKQRRTWQTQEQGRIGQIEGNFRSLGDLAATLSATRVRGDVPRSHFSNMVGLALRGIGRLNSLRNVSCEPLM